MRIFKNKNALSNPFKQVLTLFGYVAFIYVGIYIFAVSFTIPHDNMPSTFLADHIEHKMPDRAPIFVLGSSNAMGMFDVDEMNSRLARRETFNISFGGTKMISLRRTTSDILDSLPADQRSEAVFVFGLWYGVFADGHLAGPLTEISRPFSLTYSYLKYLEAWFWKGLNSTLLAIKNNKPQLVWDWHTNPPQPGDQVLRRKNLRKSQPVFFGRNLKRLDDVQFDLLVQVAKKIHSAGARMVIVDLPLGKWHFENSRLLKLYEKQKLHYFTQIETLFGDRFTYFDLLNALNEADFYDTAHIYKASAKKFSASFVNSLLEKKVVVD
jgi:hypothetical protein